jgi:hypothetical protein
MGKASMMASITSGGNLLDARHGARFPGMRLLRHCGLSGDRDRKRHGKIAFVNTYSPR